VSSPWTNTLSSDSGTSTSLWSSSNDKEVNRSGDSAHDEWSAAAGCRMVHGWLPSMSGACRGMQRTLRARTRSAQVCHNAVKQCCHGLFLAACQPSEWSYGPQLCEVFQVVSPSVPIPCCPHPDLVHVALGHMVHAPGGVLNYTLVGQLQRQVQKAGSVSIKGIPRHSLLRTWLQSYMAPFRCV
jgi:hypothetical protein